MQTSARQNQGQVMRLLISSQTVNVVIRMLDHSKDAASSDLCSAEMSFVLCVRGVLVYGGKNLSHRWCKEDGGSICEDREGQEKRKKSTETEI